MKEKPVLFSAPMVRALLGGSKTQFRRVVKPQPPAHMHTARHLGDGDWQFVHDVNMLADFASTWRCPFGQQGDLLWVKEAWRASSAHDDIAPRDIPQGDAIEYAASQERVLTGKNRPSMFMPRWASRITLEITGVRVETLGIKSHEDALAEGVSSIEEYKARWININRAWLPEAWVWAVEFKML